MRCVAHRRQVLNIFLKAVFIFLLFLLVHLLVREYWSKLRVISEQAVSTTNNSTLFANIESGNHDVIHGNDLDRLHETTRKKLIAFSENQDLVFAEVKRTTEHQLPVAISSDETLLLFIFVLSRPESFVKRQAIRLTWGKQNNEANQYLFDVKDYWRTIFVVGQSANKKVTEKVKKEQTAYRDILIVDLIESFENLAVKTLESLKWGSKNCDAKYVLKTDDDCHVNLRGLLPWLKKLHPKYNYIGRVQTGMGVVRDKLSRYYVPYSNHPQSFYPEYCAGGGYILKRDILPNLLANSEEVKIISVEDAYVGMIMQELKPKVHFKHNPRFLPFIYNDELELPNLHPCQINYAFVIHGVSELQQIKMFYTGWLAKKYAFLCHNWGLEETLEEPQSHLWKSTHATPTQP